jgi:diguanylate cyclase (GGDEF)-like protein
MKLAAVATAAGVAFVLGRLTSRNEVVAARREASTDALTGLTNRAGLMHQLQNRTRKELPYTVCLFDLNGFKPVNDRLGHRVGDELLAALGRRLRVAFPDNITARLGGDEFVVILDGIYPYEVLETFIARMIHTVERPVGLSGVPEPVKISAALGAAPARRGESPRAALHAADQAMYRSKVLGAPYVQKVRTRAIVDESPRVRLRDTRRVRVA